MPSSESILRGVLIAAIVVVAIVILILFLPKLFPSPATITPSSTEIDLGQSVNVLVSWKGGAAPYTVTLYSVSSGGCGTSSAVLGQKTGQASSQYTFTVSPTATARYCGTVTSSSGSSSTSSTITITVNPALGPPTLSLSPTEIDSGQTATVVATVTAVGGSPPYSITLYSGSSTTCSADTTAVKVSSAGTNPITGLAGTVAHFSFTAPTSATYYCAAVVNSVSSTPAVTSSAVEFAVNPALAVTLSPAAPKLDSGQSVTLTAQASQGTPPYSYQWYSGTSCSTPMKGENSSSFSTGPLTFSGSYSVMVGDSSTGSPAAGICLKSSIPVSSAFTGSSVTITPSVVIDDGQSVTLTVSWQSQGTTPYSVALTTSSSSSCGGASSTGQTASAVTGTSTTFSVSPTSTTNYCAKVTDGATAPESSSTTSAAVITVNPALTPSVSLSPEAIDSGQTATLTATVELSGGTSPYTVTLYSGSSSSCSFDTSVVVSSGANPQTALPGPTATFSTPAPSSTTYYCAKVTDSATTPVTTTSAPSQFSVNPALSASISPASPSVVSGTSITLTAETSGGVPPFSYQWFDNPGCMTGDQISGQKSQTFATPSLTSPATYSVLVTDSSVGTPSQTSCASATVKVVPVLVPSLALSPQGLDVGQSTTVTAKVTWTGGTSPYAVTLYSGTSATCASDTTVVTLSSGSNPESNVTGMSATMMFASPSSSTYYCAIVKDSTTDQQIVATPTVEFTVNPPPSNGVATVNPTVLDTGQSTTVTVTITWTGGTPTFTVALYSGSSSTCASDTVQVSTEIRIAASPATFSFAAPGSDTYYCAVVTDSGVTHLSVTTSTALLTVSAGLSPAAPVLSPLVLDYGQSTTVKAVVSWTGGTAPYTVTLYGGPSATCSADTAVVPVIGGSNPQTGLTATSATFMFASPDTSTYYCAAVLDSSAVPVTASSASSPFDVNPALSAKLAPLSPLAIDSGQTTTVTATVSWSGGTAPFTVAVYSGISPYCSSDTTQVGSTATSLFATSTKITFGSPSSTEYYCAKVTDSSGIPVAVTTSVVIFTINLPPTATISPPTPSIGSGESAPALTVTASSGTAPYTYQWFTGSTCTSSGEIAGQTLDDYTPGVLSVTSVYSVEVTDSSVGTPSSISSVCASITVAVGRGPEGVAVNPVTGMVYVADPLTNHITVIDSYTQEVVTNVTVGTLPWGIAVDSTNNLIYVTNYGSGTVSIINGTSNALCGPPGCPASTIIVGNNPEGIGINLKLGEVYVANSGSDTVSVISTSTDTVIASVPVGNSPMNIVVGPETLTPPYTVYVTNYGSDTVSVISLTSPYLSYPVTTVTVGSNPWGIAINLLTNLVYVANSGSGTVTVVNGTTFTPVTTITLGAGIAPEGIAVDQATAVAYVADANANTVTAINLNTNTVITSSSPIIPIPVQNGPWGVAVLLNPSNLSHPNLGYVTNALTNTVSVINLATNQLIVTITVS